MHFAVEQLVVQYNNVSVTSTTGEHPFEGSTVLLCNFNSAGIVGNELSFWYSRACRPNSKE